jgi:hypothetical protein
MSVRDAFGAGCGSGCVEDDRRLIRIDLGQRCGATRHWRQLTYEFAIALRLDSSQLGLGKADARLGMLENIGDLRRLQSNIDRHCDQTRP